MKKSLLILLAAGLLPVCSAQARTWTSADGSKTFEADFKSYNAESKKLTVLRAGRSSTFKLDILSEADREWVEKRLEELAAEDEAKATVGSIDDQIIGKKLKKGVLSKLEGKRFKSKELETVPEYYIVYFSASW